MAETCQKYPDCFAGISAALCMLEMDGAVLCVIAASKASDFVASKFLPMSMDKSWIKKSSIRFFKAISGFG